MAAQQASAAPTAALAAPPTAIVAAAHSPPLAQPPSLAVAQPPPLATAQPPQYPPARHLYQDYADEGPYFQPPRRQQDRRPPCCFLCSKEGHFVSHCPARSVLQRLLHQQARDPTRGASSRWEQSRLPQEHLNC